MITNAKNKRQKKRRDKRAEMLARRYQRPKQTGRAITKAMVFGESED